MLGTLGNSRSVRASESDDLYAPSHSSATSSLSADNYRDQEQSSADSAPVERPANRYTPNESDEELRRITTIHPRSYNDAKIIGESFRENIPVIMNVTDMGDTDAKRLVDFSAGLAFALHGSIERVTDKVFLLTPANLEVLGAEGTEIPVALDSDDNNLFNQG
nr:cell division protein SepF [Rothia endophytica]